MTVNWKFLYAFFLLRGTGSFIEEVELSNGQAVLKEPSSLFILCKDFNHFFCIFPFYFAFKTEIIKQIIDKIISSHNFHLKLCFVAFFKTGYFIHTLLIVHRKRQTSLFSLYQFNRLQETSFQFNDKDFNGPIWMLTKLSFITKLELSFSHLKQPFSKPDIPINPFKFTLTFTFSQTMVTAEKTLSNPSSSHGRSH